LEDGGWWNYLLQQHTALAGCGPQLVVLAAICAMEQGRKRLWSLVHTPPRQGSAVQQAISKASTSFWPALYDFARHDRPVWAHSLEKDYNSSVALYYIVMTRQACAGPAGMRAAGKRRIHRRNAVVPQRLELWSIEQLPQYQLSSRMVQWMQRASAAVNCLAISQLKETTTLMPIRDQV
jgi:hypothetical protein